ncbi:MAG TPA: hypothetical protein PL072_12175 [Phycisphaerales bacterium]|nr:hypothetical protein [Phycisphaerales bacterium]
MRWLRDIALLIVLAGLIGGGIIYMRRERDQEALVMQASAELLRLETEIKYRSATKTAEVNSRGWPVSVDPAWFENNPPMNRLVSPDRPWLEVAGVEEAGLLHPSVRVAVDPTLAAFWYNPYQGVVRARVPVMVSDERTLAVYNRINGTALASIFVRETPMPTPDLLPITPGGTDEATGAGAEAAGHEVELAGSVPKGEGSGEASASASAEAPSATEKKDEPYGPPMVKGEPRKPRGKR